MPRPLFILKLQVRNRCGLLSQTAPEEQSYPIRRRAVTNAADQ